MGKYHDFLEAYRKAYAEIPKKRQYEQANEKWASLRKEPEKFEESFKKTDEELLRIRPNLTFQ